MRRLSIVIGSLCWAVFLSQFLVILRKERRLQKKFFFQGVFERKFPFMIGRQMYFWSLLTTLPPPTPVSPAPIHADPSDWAPHYPFSPTACQGHSLCQRDTREGSSWNGDTCETSAKNSFIYPDRGSLHYNVPLIVCKTFVLTFLLPIFKSRSLPFKNADKFCAIPAIATMHPMGTQIYNHMSEQNQAYFFACLHISNCSDDDRMYQCTRKCQ